MEIKKLESASLENKKVLFLLIGLFISLGITYAAFNKSFGEAEETLEAEAAQEEIQEEEIPQTEEDTTPPPPVEEVHQD